MSDYKSGWPPGPPSQTAPPAASPLPMAPPRSVPPAATPQRIPVPASSPPPGGSAVPPRAALPADATAAQTEAALSAAAGSLRVPPPHELVDLDAEVIEAPDDELEGDGEHPAALAVDAPTAVLEPLRPMRRLSIAEPGTASGLPSSPPLPPVSAVSDAPPSPAPGTPSGSPAAANPPRDRLPSFDDPEHAALTPGPPPLGLGVGASDPDEIDTPVPAAPVYVSAPPPFVPPPSPLLPEFASVPPLAPPPASPSPPPHPLLARDVPAVAPSSEPPAAVSPAAVSLAAVAAPVVAPTEPPEHRPSRPPPVLPDAVVLAIQPGTYQAERTEFDDLALDDEEVRLSDTDLEISLSGEPPEVVSALTEDSPPAPETAAASAVSVKEPPLATLEARVLEGLLTEAPVPEGVLTEAPVPEGVLTEAPVPDAAVAVASADGAATEGGSASDAKKPPPPKRTAKPALPSAAVRRRPWWETLFGDDFARAHRSPTPRQLAHEVNFMVTNLALTQNQVVLDLGCGQGEHAVELTRRGVAVVGYDLSVFQLAMAGDRAQQEGQKINFLQGDMREMAFDAMFDAVVCWDTSFGYFEEEKNLDVARRILAGLKPGGSLLLHVMNRDFAAKQSPANIWFEGDGCVCMDDVDFDWITSRLRVKRSLILDDGRSKELHYSVRLYNLSEIGKLLHEVGFRVAHVSGDVSTPGAFFGPASPYIIIRAQRP